MSLCSVLLVKSLTHFQKGRTMVPASKRIIGKGKRKLGRVEKGGLQCTRRKGIEGKALNEEQKMEKRCWRTMTFYLENNW